MYICTNIHTDTHTHTHTDTHTHTHTHTHPPTHTHTHTISGGLKRGAAGRGDNVLPVRQKRLGAVPN